MKSAVGGCAPNESTQANGVDVKALLVETFGGYGPELLALLRDAAAFKDNKLSAAKYDETTWSARTRLTFAMQRVSVAVHMAVAKELSPTRSDSPPPSTRAGCRATELDSVCDVLGPAVAVCVCPVRGCPGRGACAAAVSCVGRFGARGVGGPWP